jgi:hypothetical protein
MASGHVNRTNRPNTRLHRPACGREESPCQPGAVHTWHDSEAPPLAHGCADTHQICPVLKVDRPCHRAAVTSHFDPSRRITHPLCLLP